MSCPGAPSPLLCSCSLFVYILTIPSHFYVKKKKALQSLQSVVGPSSHLSLFSLPLQQVLRKLSTGYFCFSFFKTFHDGLCLTFQLQHLPIRVPIPRADIGMARGQFKGKAQKVRRWVGACCMESSSSVPQVLRSERPGGHQGSRCTGSVNPYGISNHFNNFFSSRSQVLCTFCLTLDEAVPTLTEDTGAKMQVPLNDSSVICSFVCLLKSDVRPIWPERQTFALPLTFISGHR